MNYLLDVNVLVAWGWSDHADHRPTVRWIAAEKKRRGVVLATSPIPEIGFVRVSVQRSLGKIGVQEAGDVLRNMLLSLGATHRFLPDDLSGAVWPDWCRSAARMTDAHLMALASRHGMKLATIDRGVPGGHLITAQP